MLFNQMRDNLSISFSDESMVFLPQGVLQLEIVFDDAVMNDDHSASAIAMRVGIFFGRTAMRGPARVAHAVRAIDGVFSQDRFEVAQLAFGPANLQLVIFVNGGNAGGIVAAIFKLAQTLDDQGYDLFVSDVSDYSTHKAVGSKQ